MKWAEMKKQQKHDAVVGEIQKHVDSKTPIDSAAEISSWLFVMKQLKITDALVRTVMKKEFGFRYRKVKITTYQSNSERNLVLR